jgi:hypothetical protein
MGMINNPLPPEELGRRLAETVPTLQELTAGLVPAAWLHRPEQDEWSITEIICHLRDVDREVHLARLQSLIHEEQPFMPGAVPDTWAIERDYQAQDGPAALAALEEARGELLALLPPADSAIWERRGRHTFFGPTSFLELVCLVLEHDILHLQQVRDVLDSRP